MKKGMIVLCAIGFVVLILALDYGGLLWQSFIAPKRENVRRNVFEKTRSYNEAKLQDLVRYRMQYMRAKSDEDKEAISSTIRHLFSNYEDKNLTPELRDFLKMIKYGG